MKHLLRVGSGLGTGAIVSVAVALFLWVFERADVSRLISSVLDIQFFGPDPPLPALNPKILVAAATIIVLLYGAVLLMKSGAEAERTRPQRIVRGIAWTGAIVLILVSVAILLHPYDEGESSKEAMKLAALFLGLACFCMIVAKRKEPASFETNASSFFTAALGPPGLVQLFM